MTPQARIAVLAAACFATLLPGAGAAADAPRERPFELRFDAGMDNLSNDFADWRELAALVSYRPTTRLAVFGGYRETERYDQRDREASAGTYVPLPGLTTSLHFEGTWSDTHRVLARNMFLGEVVQPLGDGWVLSAGGKRTRYTESEVDAVWTQVEKYVGNWRFAYNLQVSRPEGVGWSPAHRVTGSWYRGDLTFVTLIASTGREVENIPPAGLVQSDVHSFAALGGLEITKQWGLVLELAYTKQGDLYTRRTARLGTRFLF